MAQINFNLTFLRAYAPSQSRGRTKEITWSLKILNKQNKKVTLFPQAIQLPWVWQAYPGPFDSELAWGKNVSIRMNVKHGVCNTNRALCDWVYWNQNQSNYSSQSEEREIPLRTNKNSKLIKVYRLERGKTRATKSWSVLALQLIGWESGAKY